MTENSPELLASDLGFTNLQPHSMGEFASRLVNLKRGCPRVSKLVSCYRDFTNNNDAKWGGLLPGRLPFMTGLNMADLHMRSLISPGETLVGYAIDPRDSKFAVSIGIETWEPYYPGSAQSDRFGILKIYTPHPHSDPNEKVFQVFGWIAAVDRVDEQGSDRGSILIPSQPERMLAASSGETQESVIERNNFALYYMNRCIAEMSEVHKNLHLHRVSSYNLG